jgi:hypothetical protein
VVEHYLDTVGVTGSKPVPRTIFPRFPDETFRLPPDLESTLEPPQLEQALGKNFLGGKIFPADARLKRRF